MLGDSAGIELRPTRNPKFPITRPRALRRQWPSGKIGDPALEPLLAALKDKNPHVRVLAAVALEELENPKAVEALIAALKDEDFDVQASAARALGAINDIRAVDPLIAALKDKKPEVRGSAAVRAGRDRG